MNRSQRSMVPWVKVQRLTILAPGPTTRWPGQHLPPRIRAGRTSRSRRSRVWLVFSISVTIGFVLTWLVIIPRPRTVTTSGTVFPAERRVVRAPCNGTIEAIAVAGGERVRPGELLVVLRDGELETERARIAQQIDQARSARAQRDSAVVIARAELRGAAVSLRHARRALKRAHYLLSHKLISRGEFEQSASAADRAAAELQLARARLAAERDRGKAEPSLQKLLEAERALARRSATRELRAAIAGTVVTPEPGRLVGTAVERDAPLIELYRLDSIEIRALVPQRDLQEVRRGTPVSFVAGARHDALSSRVSFVAPRLDLVGQQRVGEIRARFNNPDLRFKAGQTGTLTLGFGAESWLEAGWRALRGPCTTPPTDWILPHPSPRVVTAAAADRPVAAPGRAPSL